MFDRQHGYNLEIRSLRGIQTIYAATLHFLGFYCVVFFHVFHSTDLSGIVLNDDSHLTGSSYQTSRATRSTCTWLKAIVIRFGSWADSIKIKLKLHARCPQDAVLYHALCTLYPISVIYNYTWATIVYNIDSADSAANVNVF